MDCEIGMRPTVAGSVNTSLKTLCIARIPPSPEGRHQVQRRIGGLRSVTMTIVRSIEVSFCQRSAASELEVAQ